MSVPNNLISFKYTSGEELIEALTGKNYVGSYYELKGEKYAGSEYNLNAVRLTTLDKANTLLVNTNSDVALFSTLSGVTSQSLVGLQQPRSIFNEAASPGARFFRRKKGVDANGNPYPIEEVDQSTYDSSRSNAFYDTVFVGTYKRITITPTDAEQIFPGIQAYLAANPTKPSVIAPPEEDDIPSLVQAVGDLPSPPSSRGGTRPNPPQSSGGGGGGGCNGVKKQLTACVAPIARKWQGLPTEPPIQTCVNPDEVVAYLKTFSNVAARRAAYAIFANESGRGRSGVNNNYLGLQTDQGGFISTDRNYVTATTACVDSGNRCRGFASYPTWQKCIDHIVAIMEFRSQSNSATNRKMTPTNPNDANYFGVGYAKNWVANPNKIARNTVVGISLYNEAISKGL